MTFVFNPFTGTLDQIGTSTSTTFTDEVPPETPDDSIVAFTFSEEPRYIVVNGAFYRKETQIGGADAWSWSGTTATLQFPVGVGGDIYGIIIS